MNRTVTVANHDPIEDAKLCYQANYAHYVSVFAIQLAEVKKSNLNEKKCNVSLAGFEKIIRERTAEVNTLIDRLNELQIKRSSL